jgi:hypothetical protein
MTDGHMRSAVLRGGDTGHIKPEPAWTLVLIFSVVISRFKLAGPSAQSSFRFSRRCAPRLGAKVTSARTSLPPLPSALGVSRFSAARRAFHATNPLKSAERAGFEPAVRVSPDARLASEYLRPLGHLSSPSRGGAHYTKRTRRQAGLLPLLAPPAPPAQRLSSRYARAIVARRRAHACDHALGGAGTITDPCFSTNGWPRH